jgi:hypothetical protein
VRDHLQVIYTPHEAHRNGNPVKSQWTISVPAELRCFAEARSDGWLDATFGWGLHRPAGVPDYLGVGVNRSRQLFVAKFVRAREGEAWHGYPADPQRNPQDLPQQSVRQAWLHEAILPAVLIRRMIKGQPCAL